MKTYIYLIVAFILVLITQTPISITTDSPTQEKEVKQPEVISQDANINLKEKTEQPKEKKVIKEEKQTIKHEEKQTQKQENKPSLKKEESQVVEEKQVQPVEQEKTTKEEKPKETVPKQEPIQETSLFSSKQENLIRSTLIEYINQERSAPVTQSSALLSSATLRAKEASQKWSHTRPNGKRWNTTLTNIIDIQSVAHGENLAQTSIPIGESYSDETMIQISKLLHQGLVNSPTHYHVMTNENYKKVNIGINIVQKENHLTITIVQHFIA